MRERKSKIFIVLVLILSITAVCGAALAACVDGHSHELVYHEGKPATCTEAGWKEYWECTECHGLFGDAAMTIFYGKIPSIPATGEHNWSAYTYSDGYSCERGGTRTHTCLTCGKTETENVAPGRHTWGAWEETLAADCTHEGSRLHVCTVCGASETGTVAALGHAWSAWEEDIPADCTHGGHRTRECSRCGLDEQEDTQPLGHIAEHVAARPATCTEDGVREHYRCSACGEYFADEDCTRPITVEETVEGKLGHSMDYVPRVEPGCESSGTLGHYHCTRCLNDYADINGQTELTDTSIPPTGHNWDAGKVVEEPSCTREGKTEYTCLNGCGETRTEKIDKTPHQMQFVKGFEADCTSGGELDRYHCSECGFNYADEQGNTRIENIYTDKLGHSTVYVAEEPATCLEDGIKAHWHCSRCLEDFDDEQGTVPAGDLTIKAEGHGWGDWTTLTPATCTEDGVEVRTCGKCHKTESRAVEKLGHINPPEHVEYKAPACEEEGVKEHYHCTRCGLDFEDEECTLPMESTVIPPADHDWGEWQFEEGYSCENGGTRYRVCSACGERDSESVSAGTHTWGEWEQEKAPTCGEEGSEKRVCEVCGAEETKSVPATGNHTWDEGEVTKKPGCEEHGVKTFTCGVCGATRTENIDPTGHIWGAWEETTPAGCETPGEETCKCDNCGETKTRPVEAKGHSWGEWEVTTPAGCTTDGVCERECSACHKKETEEIKAEGHKFDENTYACSVCGEINATKGLQFVLNGDAVDGAYTLTGTGGASGVIVLPLTYEGLPVSRIAAGALGNGVTRVVIPEYGHLYIDGGAFASSVEIYFRGTADKWAGYTFASGWNQGFTLSLYEDGAWNKVTSLTLGAERVEAYAFYKADISAVIMGEGAEYVGAYAFAESNAASANLGNISVLGANAFYGCTSLSEVTLSSGMDRINAYTFAGCSSLKTLEIPANITAIGANAFFGCSFTSVTFTGTQTKWESVDVAMGNEALDDITFGM